MCPTDLPMDFTDCALATASGAVYMSEDTDSPHQVISIAAHDPDLDPQLVYEIAAVRPNHPASEYSLVLCTMHSVVQVYCCHLLTQSRDTFKNMYSNFHVCA